MKITKRQLRRIIKEERAALLKESAPMPLRSLVDTSFTAAIRDVLLDECPMTDDPMPVDPMVDSESPEADVLVEMRVAAGALDQVLESVQNAAGACHNCAEPVAAQAPLVEAMVTQASALKEMLDAQVEVIQENVDVHSDLAPPSGVGITMEDEDAIVDAVGDMMGLELR